MDDNRNLHGTNTGANKGDDNQSDGTTSQPNTNNLVHDESTEPNPEENDLGSSDMDLEACGDSEPEPPYSIFTKAEIYGIGACVSLTAYWSILSSTLYFPVIPLISSDFGVSTEAANLTVVIYLVFQSCTPMVLSGVADTYGRKPVIFVLLSCYIGICIGISQVRVYWALLVLRMFQATSIASTISICMGIVADLTPKSTRGGLNGFVNGIVLSGQALGGLFGGALSSRWGIPGIFVFCAIGAGVALIINLVLVPETNRTIVGNQSVPPSKFYHKSGLMMLPHYKKRLTNDTSTIIARAPGNLILSAIRIFFTKIVFFTMLPTGIAFATWTVSMAALSTVLKDHYGFSEILLGVGYIPAGVGSISASLTSGFILNWNFRRRKAYCEANNIAFELHKIRLEFTTRISLVFIGSALVFGWCLKYKINLAPIFIAHAILSFSVIWFLTILQTVLIDLHPAQSSAASSCLNLMRGGLSAIFVAAQDRIIKSLTIGGCFTLLAGIYAIAFVLFRIIIMTDKKGKSETENKH